MMIDEKIAQERVAAEITIENVSRRGFLRGALGASAFVLCVGKFPVLAKTAGGAAVDSASTGAGSIGASAFHPSVFVGHSYGRRGLYCGAPVGDGEWCAHQPAQDSGR